MQKTGKKNNRILVVNGPNLNMLGTREPQLYGQGTYADLVRFVKGSAKKLVLRVRVVQSNCEGTLVTLIQRARGKYGGIVINAGAYTHTSIAILDALKAAEVPAVEVHLTDLAQREDFRKISYIGRYAELTVMGKGFEGYREALAHFAEKL